MAGSRWDERAGARRTAHGARRTAQIHSSDPALCCKARSAASGNYGASRWIFRPPFPSGVQASRS